jgi:hypothetical protein
MTRVYDAVVENGGVRVLILGAGTYPNAQIAQPRVPTLPDISSASKSATDLALRILGPWKELLEQPLASLDLLVNAPGAANGAAFTPPAGGQVQLDPPTLDNIKAARTRWLAGAGPKDILIFYCCGHGIWLPSVSKTFLASDFGADPEDPWPKAVALDDFRLNLGERKPRRQWLIFDCCANTPTVALKALAARPDPLLVGDAGGRQQAIELYGDLSQVTLASSTQGKEAFGKDQRASRFMEAFIEACDGSAYMTQDAQGKWWVDQQSLERAIATYAVRVAPPADQAYFTFPRVSQTDANDIPRLLRRDQTAQCTLLVRSEPPVRLTQAELTITCPPSDAVIAAQPAGPQALARFRQQVTPWATYDVQARFPEGAQKIQKLALPPLAEAVF